MTNLHAAVANSASEGLKTPFRSLAWAVTMHLLLNQEPPAVVAVKR